MNSDFDIDFRYGQTGEKLVEHLLNGSIKTVEVKKDKRWIETGNVFIETDCYYQSINKWNKSGINVTKATHYAFVLEESVVIVTTQNLLKAIRKQGKKIQNKKEPNPSRGYLIKPEQIFYYSSSSSP